MHPPLTPNTIYAALYWRADGKYHWALIVADTTTSGQKLHATNLDHPEVWCYANDAFDVSTEWKPLVILGHIGAVSNVGAGEGSSKVDELLRTIPLETPECDAPHPFTCRIWFREAIRVLSTHGMVSCRSVDVLERELVDLADDTGNAVALGRPWKLYSDLDSVKLHSL
ncbi:hypothetical protein BV20DRAFT_966989 [Pilatotrama ljubarskyi]|nr:hypothetical protein BV20DRAFT_966989 [Pilatotrama ljubarskyi]